MSRAYLESIKVLDGKLFHLEYHQKRLNKALDTLERYDLDSLLHPPRCGLYRCRIVYTMQEVKIEYIPYQKRSIRSLKLLVHDTIVYDNKYADRDLLNKLFIQKESCDDILIIKNGLITDTSIANIAFFDGAVWFTPKTPLLKGTTRARLLDIGKIIEKDISVKEIKNYKKIALMNAMIDFDIIAVENIEDIIC